jgi:alpha-tubulin suppressor-like RCC1 family protein
LHLTTPSTKQNRFVFLGDDTFHQKENLPLFKDLINFRDISIGSYHTLVIKNDGSLIGWGFNKYNQSFIPPFPPYEKVYMVSAGENHSLVLSDKGNVFAWGNNKNNQIDIPPNLKNVIKISAGASHSLTLNNSNKVICYGEPDLPDTYNHDIIDIYAGGVN